MLGGISTVEYTKLEAKHNIEGMQAKQDSIVPNGSKILI